MSLTAFKEIGIRSGTDKITQHGYDRFYPLFLDPIRFTSDAILEIGIDKKKSVKLWLEYFPNSYIYGIDKGVEFDEDRVRVFKADQSSISDLQRVKTMINKPIKFIIDDGSHIPEHQILTFDYYFRYLLKPGGVYIVEDTEASYWKNGTLYGYPTNYGHRHSNSFIETIKPIMDTINIEFLNNTAREDNKRNLRGLSLETASLVSMMTICQNCIIFTKKKYG